MCIRGVYSKTVKRARGWRVWDLGRNGVLEPIIGSGWRGQGKTDRERDGMLVWVKRDAKMHNGDLPDEMTNGNFGLHSETLPSAGAAVFGVVSLSGTVAVFCSHNDSKCRYGYLSSHARIERLYINRDQYWPRRRAAEVAKMLRRRYRVPVTILEPGEGSKLRWRVEAYRLLRHSKGLEA